MSARPDVKVDGTDVQYEISGSTSARIVVRLNAVEGTSEDQDIFAWMSKEVAQCLVVQVKSALKDIDAAQGAIAEQEPQP